MRIDRRNLADPHEQESDVVGRRERGDDLLEQPVGGRIGTELRPLLEEVGEARDPLVDDGATTLDEPVRVREQRHLGRQREPRLADRARVGPAERRRRRLVERGDVAADAIEQDRRG